MNRIHKALDGRDAHIKSLWVVILILVGALAFSQFSASKIPERIKVDIPPDLRTGSSRGIEERHPYNVYGFSLYIFQQMNAWPVSGERDYKANIERLACFITPKYKAELERDYAAKGQRAELGRSRALNEMYDRPYEPKRVWIESQDSWVTYMDVNIKEFFRGEEVKDLFARYPIRVVRWDNNSECNPWGLALDGMYDEPQRLEGYAQDDALAAN